MYLHAAQEVVIGIDNDVLQGGPIVCAAIVVGWEACAQVSRYLYWRQRGKYLELCQSVLVHLPQGMPRPTAQQARAVCAWVPARKPAQSVLLLGLAQRGRRLATLWPVWRPPSPVRHAAAINSVSQGCVRMRTCMKGRKPVLLSGLLQIGRRLRALESVRPSAVRHAEAKSPTSQAVCTCRPGLRARK